MSSETVPAVLIIAFGVWGLGLYLGLATRPGRRDRMLSLLIALVCLAAALAWAYSVGVGKLLSPVIGRSILALALAALVWLGLARGGRHDAQ